MLSLQRSDLLISQAFVGGNWQDGQNGDKRDVVNPATGDVITQIPVLDASEVQAAIEAAALAQKSWKKQTAKQRAVILRQWRDLMMTHQEDLAQIMTAEQGKPLAEARGEVAYGASFLEWFAEEAKRVYGDIIPTYQSDRRVMVFKEPVGVCAAITPWNFPIAMITRKAGPALATGCAMVIKPAMQTPLSALAIAKLAEEAGVPKGLLSVLTGDAHIIGGEMTSNPLIRKLTFTGSTHVGRLLMQQCAGDIKKISLELGGNAPFIVCEDADIDAAVAGAIISKFRNAGQTCVCANRLYVHDKVYDEFAEKFAQAVAQLTVGSGTDAGTDIGPLIDDKATAKVSEHVRDALEKGGRLLTGGHPHDMGAHFYQPTVIADASQSMKIASEETFGPVAPLFRFHSDEEVITLANDTEFGLAAYFYSRDIGRIFKLAEALESGLVGVNAGVIATEIAPFGGYKQSGLGREGSKYGIDDYINTKYVCIAGLEGA